MNMTEKNGQPSMEEILASIRRIIAEEPSYPHNGELRGTPILVKGDGALDDASEFDLPAIFRASPPPATERSAPLLGRLTDAIRSATTSQSEARGSVNGEDHRQPAAADSNLQVLSSLKTARSEATIEPVQHLNGTSLNHPAASQEPQSASGAFPTMMAAGPPKDEPKRVMAPFKDTHFTRMSGPAPTASPSPVAQAPVAAAPAPAPAPAPVPTAQPYAGPSPDFTAIIPGQFDRATLVSSQPSYVAGQPSPVPPQPYVAPVAMPPPPLPISEPIQNALVPSPSGGGEEPGTIEDTTADLLRPMLRQWLADNMPRMVEKALHIEIAESIKAPKKP